MPSTESPDAIIEEFLLRLERDGLISVVAADVTPTERGGRSLDRIVVDERHRGRGVADRVASAFVRLCDDYAQDAEVIPKPLDDRTTQEGLERLYARHGFVYVNPGVDSLMRRGCRPVPASL